MSSLGNKDVMAKNIKIHMESAGVTAKDICSTLNIPMATFSDWIHAKTYPRIDKIEMLANYFGISKADLIEDYSGPKDAIPYEPRHRAPILGTIPAGYPVLAFDDILGYADIPYSDEENYFFLRVKGNSMEPLINSGDTVLIRKQNFAENGQVVVARVNGDEATLKRYKSQGETVLLIPENQEYNPYVVSRKDFEAGYASIIGVVVELRRKF